MLRPFPSSMRAAAITPAEPVGACVTHFPTDGSLPRFRGGSASALSVSGPARRSLTLRPAWSLSRPWRPVAPECFRRCRYLHHPLRLLPAGATVAGRDSHPLKNGAFHGAHEKLLQGVYAAPSRAENSRNLSIPPFPCRNVSVMHVKRMLTVVPARLLVRRTLSATPLASSASVAFPESTKERIPHVIGCQAIGPTGVRPFHVRGVNVMGPNQRGPHSLFAGR